MSTVTQPVRKQHNESEFLRRVLGNIRSRDPVKLAEAERAIEGLLRRKQTTE